MREVKTGYSIAYYAMAVVAAAAAGGGVLVLMVEEMLPIEVVVGY